MNIKFDLDSFFKTTKLHTFIEIFLWIILSSFILDDTISLLMKILISIFLILDTSIYFYNLFIYFYKQGKYKTSKMAKPAIYISIIENILGMILISVYGLGIIEFVLDFILAGSIWVQAKTLEYIKQENNL